MNIFPKLKKLNKRINSVCKSKTGSTLLMVVMTMSVMIIIGSSMLMMSSSTYIYSIGIKSQKQATYAAESLTKVLKDDLDSGSNSVIAAYAAVLRTNTQGKTGSAITAVTQPLNIETPVPGTTCNAYLQYVDETRLVMRVVVEVISGKYSSKLSFTIKNQTVDVDYLEEMLGNTVSLSIGTDSLENGNFVTNSLKNFNGDVSLIVNLDNASDIMSFQPELTGGITGSLYVLCQSGSIRIGGWIYDAKFIGTEWHDYLVPIQGNLYVKGDLYVSGMYLGKLIDATKDVGGNIFVDGNIYFDYLGFNYDDSQTVVTGDVFCTGDVFFGSDAAGYIKYGKENDDDNNLTYSSRLGTTINNVMTNNFDNVKNNYDSRNSIQTYALESLLRYKLATNQIEDKGKEGIDWLNDDGEHFSFYSGTSGYYREDQGAYTTIDAQKTAILNSYNALYAGYANTSNTTPSVVTPSTIGRRAPIIYGSVFCGKNSVGTGGNVYIYYNNNLGGRQTNDLSVNGILYNGNASTVAGIYAETSVTMYSNGTSTNTFVTKYNGKTISSADFNYYYYSTISDTNSYNSSRVTYTLYDEKYALYNGNANTVYDYYTVVKWGLYKVNIYQQKGTYPAGFSQLSSSGTSNDETYYYYSTSLAGLSGYASDGTASTFVDNSTYSGTDNVNVSSSSGYGSTYYAMYSNKVSSVTSLVLSDVNNTVFADPSNISLRDNQDGLTYNTIYFDKAKPLYKFYLRDTVRLKDLYSEEAYLEYPASETGDILPSVSDGSVTDDANEYPTINEIFAYMKGGNFCNISYQQYEINVPDTARITTITSVTDGTDTDSNQVFSGIKKGESTTSQILTATNEGSNVVYTITEDLLFDGNFFVTHNGEDSIWPATSSDKRTVLRFNTTAKALHIYFRGDGSTNPDSGGNHPSNSEVFSRTTFEIVGTNDVFIYLLDGTNLVLKRPRCSIQADDPGSYLQTNASGSKFYVIANAASTVKIGTSSSINALVYMPEGTLWLADATTLAGWTSDSEDLEISAVVNKLEMEDEVNGISLTTLDTDNSGLGYANIQFTSGSSSSSSWLFHEYE